MQTTRVVDCGIRSLLGSIINITPGGFCSSPPIVIAKSPILILFNKVSPAFVAAPAGHAHPPPRGGARAARGRGAGLIDVRRH